MRFVLLLAIFLSSSVRAATLTIEVRAPSGVIQSQSVEVFTFEEGKAQPTKNLKTGSDGKIRVNVSTAKYITAAARTVYQDVSYFTDMVRVSQNTNLTLKVFPATTSVEGLLIEDLQIFARPAEKGLHIDQDWSVENPNKKTVTGGYRITLPSKGFDLQLHQGFAQELTKFEGNDIVVTTPLAPGKNRFSLSYNVEGSRTRASFEPKFSLPINSVSLGLAEGLTLQSDDFRSSGRKIFNEEWVNLFERDLKDANAIVLDVGGLPLNLRFSQWLPWLISLCLILILWILPRKKFMVAETSIDTKTLDELLYLERARHEKMLSESEYQLRRLPLLEKLMSNYASS